MESRRETGGGDAPDGLRLLRLRIQLEGGLTKPARKAITRRLLEKRSQMSVELEEPEAPTEKQATSQDYPISRKVVTDEGGYFWNTGCWGLPDGAPVTAAEGQAAVVLPDEFPRPKGVQLGIINCNETRSYRSSAWRPQRQLSTFGRVLSPVGGVRTEVPPAVYFNTTALSAGLTP